VLIVGWVVATALGAFLGSFFAKRGEIAALKRDLETIKTTLAQTTRVSEDIQAEVAGLIARIAVASSVRTVLARFVDEWNKAAGSDERYRIVARWGWLILSDRGEAGRAEELLRRALVIQERYFGPRHPSLTFTLNGLARL